MKERRLTQPLVARCKLVLVGDVQCGKTAMLQVLAKDSYPETYVPTVFENYTACLELEEQRVELSLWDTSGSPYYDNVRPLCYSDSDAVLLCFDVSRPDSFDGALKKWKTEILDFCPSTRILLIGCKTDLRTDVCTLMELSNQKQTPISHEQVSLFPFLSRSLSLSPSHSCSSPSCCRGPPWPSNLVRRPTWSVQPSPQRRASTVCSVLQPWPASTSCSPPPSPAPPDASPRDSSFCPASLTSSPLPSARTRPRAAPSCEGRA
uniref:Rho family GTPase 1 n=1 Tax=Oncorhynchus kisutch TaxID=8019 RepID=A0A8C7M7S0_ONCKI